MAANEIDVIAFTSSPQVHRLFEVAKATGREQILEVALRATVIAAVGPVVAGELEKHGLMAKIMPDHSYSMKPLVSAIVEAMSA